MARIYQDSFDSYGTGTDGMTNPPWLTAPAPVAAAARTGGFGLRNTQYTLDMSCGVGGLAGPYTEIYCGFFARPQALVTLDELFVVRDTRTSWAASNNHITVAVTIDAVNSKFTQLAVYRGDNGGTQLGSTVTFTYPNGYGGVYFEFNVKIHDTTGQVTIRADSVEVFAFTGDTRNAGAGEINALVWQPNGADIDDLYINTTSGSVNNGFSGDQRIYIVMATGVGNYAQFDPSAGANWENVDEIDQDVDVTYNDTSVVGEIDTFAFADVAPSPALNSVSAVQWRVVARRADASASSIKRVYRRGGTDYKGSATALGDAYKAIHDVLETDPVTAAAWAVANFNSGEWGYESV